MALSLTSLKTEAVMLPSKKVGSYLIPASNWCPSSGTAGVPSASVSMRGLKKVAAET
ncbi:hypothetical protein D3C86_1947370 [compost metagenome]